MPVENKAFGELFAEKKNELDHLQLAMASILPSFPGQMAAKYFDLAIGVDFHSTVFPPSPLLPVPHIGMVFDIMGAIMSAIAVLLPEQPPPPEPDENGKMPPPPPISVLSVATAVVSAMKPSVKVHGQWVANAGTGIQHLPGIFVHLPFPIVSPMASSEMWMGSASVLMDGGPASTQFHPALSCNLVGFPSLFRMNKAPKPKVALMAPTSMLLVITSGGKPVLVGGPPTIDLFQLMFKMGLKGLGKIWKRSGKMLQNAIDKIKSKNPKLGKVLQSIKCRMFGEPVDAATGRVYANNVDFELPGPIPLIWERTYYSDAEVETNLGYNWHHSYNMGMYDMGNGFFTIRLSDGRETVMPALALGEIFYKRKEQLTWQRNKEGYFLTDHNKLIYKFNGTKNKEGFAMLSSIENTVGIAIKFKYNYKGQLTQIIDSCNRQLKVTTDQLGHITAISTLVKDESINFIEYKYDAAGNMIQTTDASGATKYFTYDEHLLIKLTNQSGTSFYWEYEGKGDAAKCIHTWGDNGVLEYWTQYEEGKTTTRNSLGHSTEYHFDENNLIYTIIDANGGVTHQTYNDYDELVAIINPNGHTVSYAYNDWGNITKQVNENEASTLYSYDEQQNLKSISTPGGMQLQWEHDEFNRLIKKTGIDGNSLVYEYEANHLKYIKDHKKRVFEFAYDEQHNLTQLIYPNKTTRTWEVDAMGNTTKSIDSVGNITRYKYDVNHNIVWVKEPDGNEHFFEYDASGNMIKASDDSHDVSFTYAALGTLLSRTQNNRKVQFNYDTELQLRSIANEGGELYKFGLDANGNVVNEWGFDGLHRRYQRDGAGRVQKVLRPNNKWTSYEYDGVGNVVKEEHSDGSTAAYRYNKDGFLVEAFNEDGQIELIRNKQGSIISEKQGAYEVEKQYDTDGNCVLTTSNLGANINMDYTVDGFLEKMSASIKTDTENAQWESIWKRDDNGLELHRQLSGQVAVKTERDQLGRVTRRSIGVHNVEQSRSRYEWAKGNKLTRIVNELTQAKANFDYDAFDNLISATYTEKKETETIYRVPDKIGNLFKTKDRSDRHYNKGGQLASDPSYYYHYDAEGNLIFKEYKTNDNIDALLHHEYAREHKITIKGSATGYLYKWAANGMLQQVTNPGGVTTQFHYDPLGRRIAKTHKNTVTRWVWDGNVPLHEWKYEGGYPPQSNINESGTITATKEPVENLITWVFEAGSFVPCAKIENDNQYSIVADYLGTPTHSYNNAGEQVWEREIDCYGSTRKLIGEKGFCPYLYQGQYVDGETGLAYNRFRYYDNESGNYISQDPIGLDGGNNTLYSYVHDSNLWIDEFGLNQRRRKNGQFAKKPGPSPKPKPSTHGNSNASTKENILYAKYDKDDNFEKWGKTDNPNGRYSGPELDGGRIDPLAKGNIIDIKKLERELAEKVPGPKNFESWAGSKSGQALSPEAQKIRNKASH
jgi:RHS repeat-associated protein